MADNQEKDNVSIVVCGHVDSGKSTCVGHLVYELGYLSERELEKLKKEAEAIGKGSFAFAFYMDTLKEERERGVTIKCTVKPFSTETKNYTVIDAPGHRDFIKNMITGTSQADVALLLVPADGNFATAIAKGVQNATKASDVQGQSRLHASLINLLGVKQLIVGVNKMDCSTAQYSEKRYKEVRDEVEHMLIRVGWPKKFVKESVPIIPISGWEGDNLFKKSDNMSWWKGADIVVPPIKEGKKVIRQSKRVHVHTLVDALDKMVQLPVRSTDRPMRTPLSGIFKIGGVGNVLTGRVEQGVVKPGDKVAFMPTHTSSNPCTGIVFTVEEHRKSIKEGLPGTNIGMNIKNLNKDNMPKTGDVMVHLDDKSLKQSKKFTAQVKVFQHPGELKVGYSPIAYVRTAHAAVRLSEIKWKVGKETGNTKLKNPVSLKSGDMAEVVFEPATPLAVDSFKNCEGLGRVAIMEGKSVVMIGKVTQVN